MISPIDLTLDVTVARISADQTRLIVELRDGSWRSRHERRLTGEPFAYFSGLFTKIEQLDAGKSDLRQSNEELLVSIGTHLARDLLSEAMRARLLLRAGDGGNGGSARMLWILSEDPWIPWEALFLASAGRQGRFLAEAFALTVWTWDIPACAAIPLKRIGTVFPPSSGLAAAGKEHGDLEVLAQGTDRQVEKITPRLVSVLTALHSGEFSGLHFSGHGAARVSNPDLWSFPLDEEEALHAVDLATCDLTATRPVVFLNACRTGRSGLSLTGLGGLARAFLEARAGAVIGTRWEVRDGPGRAFSCAFYQALFEGASLGEAALLARRNLRQEFPGDPAWLAYAVFGHPAANTDGVELHLPPPRHDEPGLTLPFAIWDPEKSPPGALLRADHRIVPFHGRQRELEDLNEWCSSGRDLGVRLYTGRGGMGKTRLALELCRQLREQGWRCGFVPNQVMDDTEQRREWARNLLGRGGPFLAVVDYAERRDELLVPLLQELAAVEGGPYRLMLISRELGDWWERLRAAPDRVRDPLMGPAFSHRPLGPLAQEPEQRAVIFRQAARAFAGQLGKAVPERLPADLDAPHYRVVLLLHIAALGAVEGVQVKGEDGLLDWVLSREREFWQGQIDARRLPSWLVRGVGRAMAVITLGGGVPKPGGALELLSRLRHFGDQNTGVLTEISHLLHETYPGDLWISPLQPDILGEHLVERETEEDLEVIEIVYGPRGHGGDAGTARG
jgi:hypothetical protein